MAEQKKPEPNASPRPFDVHTLGYLIELMSEHELTEVYLEEGEQVIRLRRGPRYSTPASPNNIAPPQSGPGTLAASHTAISSAEAAPKKNYIEIKSPTPGTFYRATGPDAEPFVKVGSKVKPDTIVCIIEAMKVFNEIPAEVSGTVAAIKVEDKQPVEYGQVLFHIEPD